MNDFRKIVEQSRAFWGRLSKGKQILVGAAASVGLIALLAVGFVKPTESYATLFAGMQAEDAGKVLEQLKALNAPYKLEANGTTIAVPSARVHELRLLLAQSGLPRGGGIGFEVFDKQMFGTTSFVEQMNYRRALQGELQRSIQSLDAVERARVHIAIRERSLFKTQDEPPSASIVLALRPGRSLGPAQVKGVVHLVAASVEGLRQENISIVDESGTVLWSGDEAQNSLDSAHDLERRLQRRVSELVERVVGAGNAQVAITLDVESTKNERTEEVFDKDRSVLRSEQRNEELTQGSDNATTGGVVGARGNLPGAPPPTPGSALTQGRIKYADTRNFEITKTTTRTTQPLMKVRRLHVAILVDEAPDPKKPGAFIPRTKEELDHLTALATQAAGIDAERGDKIEVRSVPFGARHVEAASATASLLPADPRVRLAMLIGTAAIGGVLLLGTLIFLIRRGRNRKPKALIPEILPTLPLSVGRMESMLNGETVATEAPALPAPTARERAQSAAKRDAARAARVLSAWLQESAAAQAANDPNANKTTSSSQHTQSTGGSR